MDRKVTQGSKSEVAQRGRERIETLTATGIQTGQSRRDVIRGPKIRGPVIRGPVIRGPVTALFRGDFPPPQVPDS
ncbi:hypothetical protein CA13_38350 [Planctomycetes bacterium CA13]|uniref:Uncharacterized protein n=1 Tax=Novipirellula herctigrandis TaxID=2527986 RepID=A0A5C5Z759_9BACT|nr:hypothetical protein CA13_38350 [Planctomycetes bacterium CA13]